MDKLLCTGSIQVRRNGLKRIYTRQGVSPERVLGALSEPGEAIAESKDLAVRRAGDWVIREGRFARGAGALKHTLRRGRHRRAWLAAHHLRRGGVATPTPLAFVEKSLLGMIFGYATVFEYLEGCRNVQTFLRALVKNGAGKETVTAFLRSLADAVNGLIATGAYHERLLGENILTRDGAGFYFIDLESVVVGGPYDERMRLKNHAQLYGAFSDFLNDAMLVPFIERMLPPGQNPRMWMPAVRRAHQESR